MYSQLGNTPIPAQTCVQPVTTILSDGAPYTSSQTTTASQPFWVPQSPTSACNATGIVGAPAGSLFAQPVVVSHTIPDVISNVSVPASMQKVLGTLSSAQASGNFFKPIGEDVVVTCFPVLNTSIQLALNPLTDSTTSASLPTALGNTVTASAITANSSCTVST
jgi:hypothetical protein